MSSIQLTSQQAVHQHTLYAVHDYQRKFINIGVTPSSYQNQDSYKLRAKQIHVDVPSTMQTAFAIDVTTNALAKLALLEEDQIAEVNPYAVEIDENGLTASNLDDEFNQSVLNLLKIQSDALHKAKLLSIAHQKPSWHFVADDFSRMISDLISEASVHYSQQSRKILLMPEFIGGKLLSTRLPTDRSRSFMDELKDIASHFNIYIEQYPTSPTNIGDLLLIQHDALTIFPGNEPYLRREYEAPNGLTRTRQFLFSVAGYVLNGRQEQRKHIVVHVPIVLQATQSQQVNNPNVDANHD